MLTASAAAPLAMCTGVPPAESYTFSLSLQPCGFHVQLAIGQYCITVQPSVLDVIAAKGECTTNVTHRKTQTMIGPRRPRSANAPTASMVVNAANMS